MKRSIQLLAASLCLLAPCFRPPLAAGVYEAVTYELGEGSVIQDECAVCGRPPIIVALRGTFSLAPSTRGTAESLYDVTEVAFQDARGDYRVSGSGTFTFDSASRDSQALQLEVEINGVSGIVLSGGSEEVAAVWPAIEVDVSESEVRDPFHVYSLHLTVTPQVKLVPYDLKEGSYVGQECPPCARLPPQVPLAGTFLLGEMSSPTNPNRTYWIEAIDFRSASGTEEWRVSGSGIYRQLIKETFEQQAMDIVVAVNDRSGIRMKSGPVPIKDPFPEIDIQVREENPDTIIYYSLRIIAGPRQPPLTEFRRGDASADGFIRLDDALRILSWIFTNGPAPACLDAADTNDDETIDASDPLYLLFYQFLAGPEPPAPGPKDCGPAPAPSLGCGSYASCNQV